ncbi:integrase [Granulicella aggregans]|uniref:Integrase n=1 Tax=Granulicella aggregans TaxID=474949 RepID=A0A7W8E5B3_9BACT|nr:site-specific integrase [Granulicella aggregans]MBB5059104.1 integrase [Granulicella aggregans]
MSRRYQEGCLYRERRNAGPDVWVFRWRDGTVNRKEKVGTVDEFATKSAAMRACEQIRANINRDTRSPRTFGELASHYAEHELPTKTPYTGEVYAGYLKTWILPKWASSLLSDVKAVAVESWLSGLSLAPGTKAKIRNLMHAVYNHAMRWEFAYTNPITLVRQSAKRTRVPDVLTTLEIGSLLVELENPWRTAVYVALTTGLRVSELLALKWADFDFVAGEIQLSRGIVRQHVGEMKTEASRKPIPLDDRLASVLLTWRGSCPYNQDGDFLFGSPGKGGTQPYWPTAGMEDHVRPAAKRAGIQKRVGWHTLRHSFGTLVKSQGADVATTQALLRHANVSITMDRYVQAVTPAKREAQSRIVKSLPFPNVPMRLTTGVATV